MIPAPGFTLTKGRLPKTEARKLHVQFRNGEVSRWTFTADQLRWTHEGHDFDVVAVKFA